MPKYVNEDFEFSVPDNWVQRTVINWVAPAVLGKLPASFGVSYDAIAPDEELLTYANRQIDSLRGMLKDWQLIEQRAIRIDGQEALSAVFSWTLPSAKMMQRQSFVRLDKRRVVSIGCTAAAADFAAADSGWFETIQNSLRFRG